MLSSDSASDVSNPGWAEEVSKCAKLTSPSGILVSEIPIGNLPLQRL